MDAHKLADLLKKYLNNTASEEERTLVDAWLKQREANAFYQGKDADLTRAQFIKEKIDKQIRINKYKRTVARTLVGAACICLFSLGLNYWTENAKERYEEQFVVQASKNQKVRIRMTDGSIIMLNAESKCSYSKKFGVKERRVQLLKGEAYFDVAANQHQPFVVETRHSRTLVLGTAFNINIKEAADAVTLRKGKVAVTSKQVAWQHKPLYLKPNERALIVSNKTPMKEPADALSISNWNRIYFEGQTLENAANKLMQVYGIQIDIHREKLRKVRFSASFNLSDKPTDVIYELAKANNFNYKWANNQVTLY
ncbi:FecR family protein [Olivibacter jilunii]|uniref:FecR family protein n=1 Tax=Olivibacter jilunii TaxID=985016 RepID=UPI003F18CFE7